MKKVLAIIIAIVLVIVGVFIYKNNTKKTYTEVATSSEVTVEVTETNTQ